MGPSNGPPTRAPPRAPSALSYDHGGDTGSDIYVTSAAYKAPSEIRLVKIIILFTKQSKIHLFGLVFFLNFRQQNVDAKAIHFTMKRIAIPSGAEFAKFKLEHDLRNAFDSFEYLPYVKRG